MFIEPVFELQESTLRHNYLIIPEIEREVTMGKKADCFAIDFNIIIVKVKTHTIESRDNVWHFR